MIKWRELDGLGKVIISTTIAYLLTGALVAVFIIYNLVY